MKKIFTENELNDDGLLFKDEIQAGIKKLIQKYHFKGYCPDQIQALLTTLVVRYCEDSKTCINSYFNSDDALDAFLPLYHPHGEIDDIRSSATLVGVDDDGRYMFTVNDVLIPTVPYETITIGSVNYWVKLKKNDYFS